MMDSEFMKPVQNSDNEEETDSLLLQSNLEYSSSNYASASVFKRLRMESENLFDERNQGDLLDSSSETTQPQWALTESG